MTEWNPNGDYDLAPTDHREAPAPTLESNYLAFLESAGQGCISGNIREWPQLIPACAWAYAEIMRLRALAECAEESERETALCPTCGEGRYDEDGFCSDAFHVAPWTEACGCVRKPGRWGSHLVTACKEHENLLRKPTDHREAPAPTLGEKIANCAAYLEYKFGEGQLEQDFPGALTREDFESILRRFLFAERAEGSDDEGHGFEPDPYGWMVESFDVRTGEWVPTLDVSATRQLTDSRYARCVPLYRRAERAEPDGAVER